MGTAVLRSQDCLKGRLHVEAFRADLRPAMKHNRKKPARSSPLSPPPAPPKPSRHSPPAPPKPRHGRKVSFAEKENRMVVKAPSKNLVMGEVTILKRGEEPKRKPKPIPSVQPVGLRSEPAVSPAARLGPEPEILPKGIRFAGSNSASAYAGPGFFSSPAPSALPFPALFVNKDRTDEATRGLRGLLRLDPLPRV